MEHRDHRDSTKGSSSSGVSSDLSDSDHDIDDHTKVFDFHIEASTQTQGMYTQVYAKFSNGVFEDVSYTLWTLLDELRA